MQSGADRLSRKCIITSGDTPPVELMTEEEKAFHACRDQKALSATDHAGRTLLHVAAQGGKAAICRLYLSAGIDPSKLDNAGRTAADVARAAGYASLSRTLENAIVNFSAAASEGPIKGSGHLLDVREQKALIAGDADILDVMVAGKRLNSRNAKGDTPLHLAAAGGHLLLCSQLVDAGADASSLNDNGQTPAEMASEAGHRQLAVLLSSLSRDCAATVIQPQPPVEQELEGHSENSTPELDETLGNLEFETEEGPAAFHSRQGIDTVVASFVPVLSGSGLQSKGPEYGEDWELPSSLVKVRATDLATDTATGDSLGNAAGEPDFSSPNGRSSRRPRKLKSTRFSIDELACRQWAQAVLEAEQADELVVRDLIDECQGNHSLDELAANVRKVLIYAGVRTQRAAKPFLLFPLPSTAIVDEDDLVEAIVAACTRKAVVPGAQPFSVDRGTEERLVRAISNARHELLNAILDDRTLLSAILLRGQKVLEGEITVDSFTDLEIEIADDEDIDVEFCANLAALREAHEMGVAVAGRARRKALEALDRLELARSCLNDLVQSVSEKARDGIGPLLAACDRSAETFLVAHLPFARRETAKMALPEEDPEELFQEAYFALRRASERFDPERGIRFYVYAFYWIRQQIGRWRANNMSLIRLPVHRHELTAKIAEFREEFTGQFYRQPTDHEIAEYFECDVNIVKSVAFALSEPLEFDQVMSKHPDTTESPDEHAEQSQAERITRNKLNSLVPREEAIIRMRFGIGLKSDMTLEEVGQIYDVTRERIRQIEAKALRKLKHPTRSRILRQLL